MTTLSREVLIKFVSAELAFHRSNGSATNEEADHRTHSAAAVYYEAILSLLHSHEPRPTCEWAEDGDEGGWRTGCGHYFYFDGGGAQSEHGQKVCGYCGGTLVAMEFKP